VFTSFSVTARDGMRLSAPGALNPAPDVHVAQSYDFGDFAFIQTSAGVVAIDAGTSPDRVRAAMADLGLKANTASWAAVIQRLQADGYTVYAPPNPLQGLTYDSAYLADFLHSISGPIVLVGHSYGGDVITNAATGDTQVKALVYVDAFAPAQNQTLAQLLASYPGSCAEPSNLTVVPFPGAPAGTGDAYITQSAFPSCMANGLPAREAQALAADQAPLATIALTQPSGVPAWKTIPSWAVVGTADHAIPPALQLAMAENAHAHITEVNAPHLAMISDPGVVTSVILQAARATT
jgi:pimeloyl-ACP methyl ester carboxylesterase